MPILTPWGPTLYHNQLNQNLTTGILTASSGTTANTKGTYTQIIAATDFDIGMIGFQVNTALFSAGTQVGGVWDLAIGSAGNEKVIVPNVLCGGAATSVTYWYPIFIPKGSRIAFRLQSESTTSRNLVFQNPPLIWPASPHLKSARVAFSYGADLATSFPSVIPTVGASGAWGAVSEIVASTPIAFRYVMPSFGVATNNVAITGNASTTYKLLAGSAGNEKVIVPVLSHILPSANEAYDTRGKHFVWPVDIPAGTRLSISGTSSAGSTAAEFGVGITLFA